MILGIDTSNYTTSVCLIDSEGSIRKEGRMLLSVKEGGRGLQQSAALFQHIKNLPTLLEEIGPINHLSGVAVSVKPRPLEGSYMPVFLAGESVARAIAASRDVPLFRTTHQEGHISAGEGSAGNVEANEFLAVHISGGTTDLLRVKRLVSGYIIEELGSSSDLHAGQFVDRVGVALGLPFPSGPHLEKLAMLAHQGNESASVSLPVSVRGYDLSFSGPASAALRLIEQGADRASIARAVEKCIAKALEKVLLRAMSETGLNHILIVGGVAANGFIRARLRQRMEHPAVKAKLYFAEPQYSTDNAFGVARLGLLSLRVCSNSIKDLVD
jgi:N6-L-threonylcarbamoyladenine synthase